MKYLDLTLPMPAENLACDEALLDLCDAGYPDEILRVWEPRDCFVVLGYANQAQQEANVANCRALNVPVLRRFSGGGTVVQGPGCLNYSLVLEIDDRGPLRSVSGANGYVLKRHQQIFETLLQTPVQVRGHTDLTLGDLKFSGNAQRRKQECLLFHGSFLLNFDISLMERLLLMPAKQPAYRQNRRHQDFLVNLSLSPAGVKEALQKCWNVTGPLDNIPFQKIAALAKEKYSEPKWTLKF
jgi:lipoate---protein ligase